jgi:bifunctional enzyme CysN/CysC
VLNEQMNIVFVGHVDHGKSTIIGRLLAETNSLPEGKLEKLKNYCERNSKPFEYAFLLDALGEEQAQGITIDIARCFFKTHKRKYLILDAPGHIEFLKNLVTGAANAEAGCLVIDAKEGIKENSRRHAYMLSLLGVKQVVVLINKIDLINYDEAHFNFLKTHFNEYLEKIKVRPLLFIPISGREGDNIAKLSSKTSWYKGRTILEALDELHKELSDENKVFRMPVQDVYKFTEDGDDRRIIAGQVITGKLQVGDKVIFHPSGNTSYIKSIESFNSSPLSTVSAGFSTGFTLQDQIYVKRGEIASKANEAAPIIASTLKVVIFWLGRQSLQLNTHYWFKLGTSKTKAVVTSIINVLNTSTLESHSEASEITFNQVAECIIKLFTPITYDDIQIHPALSRFVIVDKYDIAGGGIIQERIIDNKSLIQEKFYHRNLKWITSNIALEEREERFKQQAKLILITGDCTPELRQTMALQLERYLFDQGKNVYFIGIGNVKHALETEHNSHSTIINEDLKKFSEVLNILLTTGLIVIAAAAKITQEDLNLIKMATGKEEIMTIWLGDQRDNLNEEVIYFDATKPLNQLFVQLQSVINPYDKT